MRFYGYTQKEQQEQKNRHQYHKLFWFRNGQRCQVAHFIEVNPKRKVKNLIVLTYCHSNYKSCLALI